METTDLYTKLEDLINPVLEVRNLELVELHISGGQRRRFVRLYVDRPTGINVGECAEVSREIGDAFDTFDPIAGAYILEVSSPGLTRQLKTDRDFERVIGKKLQFDATGLGECVGKLQEVHEDHLRVEIEDEVVSINRDQIHKANLHFEI
ncbi:MAG: ribosome maturation factor RimP [Candidatus Latescibacteria bacterium]|nr:ribosome maturation factor RimP [Candidatus Latescibacterota bacterium]MBT4141446.1 ribosome maturation factor RimP [Candidatus Latescibacterota bacterium]MBT5831936.1 ribosome maturation factor RimP [Candidatus Latescibacterota bacterium]